MNTLYIIGNGFDLYHDLPTSYSSFQKFVINNIADLENIFEEYFSFKANETRPWSNFEDDLGSFNWEYFFKDNCHIDIHDENFKPSSVFDLEDSLEQETNELIEKVRNAFESWLIDINPISVEKRVHLKQEALFINFNYTMTLEKVYTISSNQIFHIHGDVEKNQGDLIFGHSRVLEEEPELDENGDSNRTIFSNSMSAAKHSFYAFRKPVKDIIANNIQFYERLVNTKEIIILGHSLNQIDIPYFVEILKYVKYAKWNISYHADEEKKNHIKALQKIGVSKSNIALFKMNELFTSV